VRETDLWIDFYLGVVQTELSRYFGGRYQAILNIIIQILTPILWFFIKDSEDGAQTTIYLATDIYLDNVTGKYFRFRF
jgi:hypothetical protein